MTGPITGQSMEVVRLHDKDRFLATLFAPEDDQPHLFAIFAFAAEVARVRDVVHESQIGEIRLQWWHDTIDGIFAGVDQEHPIARELAESVAAHSLPKQPLLNLIAAHRHDLYADQFATTTDLEGYMGETEGALFQLACLILGGSAPEASGLAGVSFGIARMLTALPRNRNLVPVATPVSALLALAERRFTELKPHAASLPTKLRPALLPSCLAPLYLAAARRSGQDIEKRNVAISQLRRQWCLWRQARKKIL